MDSSHLEKVFVDINDTKYKKKFFQYPLYSQDFNILDEVTK